MRGRQTDLVCGYIILGIGIFPEYSVFSIRKMIDPNHAIVYRVGRSNFAIFMS